MLFDKLLQFRQNCQYMNIMQEEFVMCSGHADALTINLENGNTEL